ncbi:proteasome subunit alpha type 5, putative [Eimeria necatrix]|uniref:Proteasome subunit alpha type n=1 Tax=Eimeria necatrix TaxID=51315 RepID=U6MMU2_9EIME|nr:proteasome subunit alpha type 5, putative [Eimeria necatrix]CDJ64398.1 proteasome subunit alpha type 5, putative [Eimeria necatrix]
MPQRGSAFPFVHVCRSEYDRGVNTFSPEGRLFQVEYALGAIKLGSTAIGIQTKDGVVLASERRITSCLLEPQSIQKIAEVDTHIACAMSGLIADARTLIDHARVECANHFFTFNEKMSVRSCVDAVADLALDFSDVGSGRRKKTMSRPFGVALIVGGVDKEGPALYSADPSGTVTKYLAVAMGSAQEGAEAMLQEQYNENMSMEAAEDLALVVLRQVMEEKLNSSNVEMAALRVGETKFKQYTPDDLKEIIARLPAPSIPTATDLSSSSSS